jgi:hypothetical protein
VPQLRPDRPRRSARGYAGGLLPHHFPGVP